MGVSSQVDYEALRRLLVGNFSDDELRELLLLLEN